jgi:hypothetical protein
MTDKLIKKYINNKNEVFQAVFFDGSMDSVKAVANLFEDKYEIGSRYKNSADDPFMIEGIPYLTIHTPVGELCVILYDHVMKDERGRLLIGFKEEFFRKIYRPLTNTGD